MIQDELIQKALELFPVRKKENKKGTGDYDPNIPRRKAFIKGGQYALKNLWKDVDDTLPDIDKEVIVLVGDGVQHNIHEKEHLIYKVCFGHRPNPNGWDGKDISTGKITHYEPKLYDEGGWNQPNVKYWLDLELPKEIE